MLDLHGTAADPIEDYLAALRFLDGVAGGVEVVLPATGQSAEPVRCGHASTRIGPSAQPGWEWVGEVRGGQLQRLGRSGA